jgi:hypothetical protein
MVWSLKRHVTFHDPYKIAVPPFPPNSSPPLTKFQWREKSKG